MAAGFLGALIGVTIAAVAIMRPSDAELIARLADLDMIERQETIERIASRGTRVVPALERACGSASPRLRGGAIRALARSSASADVKVRALLTALEDPAQSVRVNALIGVERAGVKRTALLWATLRRLDDPDPVVVKAAIDTLGRIGSWAPAQVVPVLSEIVEGHERNFTLAIAATRALEALGSASSSALPVLRAFLGSIATQGTTRTVVQRAIRSIEDRP